MFKNKQKTSAAWAFILCVFGIALMDHALRALRPSLTAAGNGRIDPEEMEKLKQFLSFKPFVEVILIAVITFVSCRLTRTNGFRANEFALVMMIIGAMTIGRSLFGVGEGFSTDFLSAALPGTLIGFVVYGVVRSGRPGL